MKIKFNDIRNDLALASSYCREALADLSRANEIFGKLNMFRTVLLPCNFGDKLWFCYDDDDDGLPKIERSDPIKGFLVEPDGKISATTDFVCFDEIGGPDLFLTKKQAKDEQMRRYRRHIMKTKEEED